MLTAEKIDATIREAMGENSSDESWGPDSLNAIWLEDIGRPIARAIERAVLESAQPVGRHELTEDAAWTAAQRAYAETGAVSGPQILLTARELVRVFEILSIDYAAAAQPGINNHSEIPNTSFDRPVGQDERASFEAHMRTQPGDEFNLRGHQFGVSFVYASYPTNLMWQGWQARAALPVAPAGGEPLTEAARDVLAERKRQIDKEGWTPEHDDEHCYGEMGIAAACYATCSPYLGGERPQWPWDTADWKPKDQRSNLIRAGALVLAEIERLDRARRIAGDSTTSVAPGAMK